MTSRVAGTLPWIFSVLGGVIKQCLLLCLWGSHGGVAFCVARAGVWSEWRALTLHGGPRLVGREALQGKIGHVLVGAWLWPLLLLLVPKEPSHNFLYHQAETVIQRLWAFRLGLGMHLQVFLKHLVVLPGEPGVTMIWDSAGQGITVAFILTEAHFSSVPLFSVFTF